MQFQHMCCVMLCHPSHFDNSQEPLILPMILIIDPQKLAQCEGPSSKWSLVTNLRQRTTSNMLTQNALASSTIENNTFV
jgi:hypothetical protein